MVAAPLLLLSLLLATAAGHGNMKLPYTWPDSARQGVTVDMTGCVIEHLEHPSDVPNIDGMERCINMWFTNNTFIPGEQTIPEDMLDNLGLPKHRHNPWFSPGSAWVGGPCGVYGGNPAGCRPGDPTERYGDCCPTSPGTCGGFAFGEGAELQDWPAAPLTEWPAGSVQEVAWHVSANHGGGYSYRLCRLPDGGKAELTEECFQQGQLDLVGDTHWVEVDTKPGRQEVPARRTREGTNPLGSQWTLNPIDNRWQQAHVFDQVSVPLDLQPGEYVLSFRWDCQGSSQVWSTCSNVLIV